MTLALILETILRTILVAGLAGLGLALFRRRSSTVKLAVWRLVLYASLLMPLATLLPKRALVLPEPAPVARAIERATTQFVAPPNPRVTTSAIDWQAIALRVYALIAGLLLLRATLGLLRLRQLGANATRLPALGPDVFESQHVNVPVAFGILHPRILLPADWHAWPNETLDAVLAHERAHIAGRDFLTLSLSKINRAVYWVNPVAWWMDRQLAQLAEHASDDAALNRVSEPPIYAAMLLSFAERRSNLEASAGVAMASAGGVSSRIDRILDEAHKLSQPLSRLARAALAATAFVAVIVIGACKMSTVSAQTQPPKPKPQTQTDVWWTNDHNQQEWELVTQHGASMGHNSGAAARAKSVGSRSPGDYLWFTRDGKEYLIDDPKTLAEIQDWFKPMEELGRKQGELGEKQGALGEEMGKLGTEMGKLGEEMSRVKIDMPDLKKVQAELAQLNQLQALKLDKQASLEGLAELQARLGELQSRIGEAQARAGDKQSKIGDLQARIGEKQALLGERQGELGALQGELGEKQAKIAEEAERKLRHLFDQAIEDGRAKPVR